VKSAEDQLRGLLERWRGRTFTDLKAEAERELNGTAFESIRVDNGPRGFLIICATGAHEISLIEETFTLQDYPVPGNDWNTTTLFKMALDTERGLGVSYQEMRDARNKRSALILCATRPEKIRILEIAFSLSP
jgi:hypothetical protein